MILKRFILIFFSKLQKLTLCRIHLKLLNKKIFKSYMNIKFNP